MSGQRLLVGPLMSEAEAALWVCDEELQQAASFGTEQRRREFLTWRAMLRRELGRELKIGYNELGAPVLPDRREYLSVSHAADRVAVLLSMQPTGVDIERMSRRYHRILHKYLTPAEQALSSDTRFYAAAWCAKEAAYKWAGIRDLGFEEVEILGYANDRITLSVRGGEPLRLVVEQLDEEYIMSYII